MLKIIRIKNEYNQNIFWWGNFSISFVAQTLVFRENAQPSYLFGCSTWLNISCSPQICFLKNEYSGLQNAFRYRDVDFLLTALFVWNVCLTTSYSLFLYKRISFGKSFHRKLIIGIRLGKPFYLNPRLLNLLSGKQDRLISYLFWMTSQKILNIEYVSSLKFIW